MYLDCIMADIDAVGFDLQSATQVLLDSQGTAEFLALGAHNARKLQLRHADQLGIHLVIVPHLEQEPLGALEEVLHREVLDPFGVQIVVDHLSFAVVDIVSMF